MSIDDKFIKNLKVAVKPECLISDSIWFDWFNAFNGTDIYEKNIHKVAKSKKMIWPANKADETFGYYLSMQFSKVKSSLGWDAKRTLLLCLAEEYQLIKSDNRMIVTDAIELLPPKIAITAEDVTDEIASLHNVSGLERIDLKCKNALEIINELTSNNKINYDLINLLNDHIARISKENNLLLDNKKTTENNTSHIKQLLDDMIKMSQDQIIDIDELSRENSRLATELETYKAKYYALKTNYDRLKIGSCNIDSSNSNARNQINSAIEDKPTTLAKKEPINSTNIESKTKIENSDDMKYLRSLAINDFSNDIKI